MEIFFNELSVKITENSQEAKTWLINFAKLSKLIYDIVSELSEDGLTLRTRRDFASMLITPTQTIGGFLYDEDEFEYDEPYHLFLISLFANSDYIQQDDPLYSNYEYICLNFEEKEYIETGLAAAHLKNTLAISFDNDTLWNSCYVKILVSRLDQTTETHIKEEKHVQSATTKTHILNCHLGFFSQNLNQSEEDLAQWFLNEIVEKTIEINSIEDLERLYPNYIFEPAAFEDLLYWKMNDKRIYLRLHLLLKDIAENPFKDGLGDTEALKYNKNINSKRLTRPDRVTYSLTGKGDSKVIKIHRCKGHYQS